MRALIVYHTCTGTTARVAQSMADALDDARIVAFDQISADMIQWADMIIVGSPTHYQAMPQALRLALSRMPRGCLVGKMVAAFDTSFRLWRPLMRMTAAHQVLPTLRRLGGLRLARPESFLVDAQSNLLDGELERAALWARALVAQVTEWVDAFEQRAAA